MSETIMWKTITGHPQYEVSNTGVVRNVGSGLELRLQPNSRGYLRAKLHTGGIPTRKTVASLVAEAFIGPRPEGLTINHKDGNKINNCVENLEYLTNADNMRHARKVLKRCVKCSGYGERNSNAHLTNKQVRVIRHLIQAGMSNPKIAQYFPVGDDAIANIRHGRTWQSVTI